MQVLASRPSRFAPGVTTTVLHKTLGGPWSRSRIYGGEKNLLPPTRIRSQLSRSFRPEPIHCNDGATLFPGVYNPKCKIKMFSNGCQEMWDKCWGSWKCLSRVLQYPPAANQRHSALSTHKMDDSSISSFRRRIRAEYDSHPASRAAHPVAVCCKHRIQLPALAVRDCLFQKAQPRRPASHETLSCSQSWNYNEGRNAISFSLQTFRS